MCLLDPYLGRGDRSPPTRDEKHMHFQWSFSKVLKLSDMNDKSRTLLAIGTCGKEAKLRDVFRQVYDIGILTFNLKFELSTLVKQIAFDAAVHIPCLRHASRFHVDIVLSAS